MGKENFSLSEVNFNEVSVAGLLNSLTPEQVGEFYLQGLAFKTFVEEGMKLIENSMLEGKKYPGLKVIETFGRSTSGWTDNETVVEQLKVLGYKDEDIYKPREMKTYTDIKKMIGTKIYNDTFVANGLVQTTLGKSKLTVVAESDPTPEFVINK